MSKGGTKVTHRNTRVPGAFYRRTRVGAVQTVLALLVVMSTAARADPPVPPVSPARRAPEPGSRAMRYVSAQAYFQAIRAELLLARGEADGAAEALALALVYDPESYHLHVELARLAISLGRGARVDRLLEQAIRLGPRRAPAWRLRGDVALAEGRPVDAARAYTRALTVEPASRDGLGAALALAALEVERGRDARAREVLAKAAELGVQPAIALIELETARGELSGAGRVAARVMARHGNDPALRDVAARALARAGRAEAAWAALQGSLGEGAELGRLLDAHALAWAAGDVAAGAALGQRIDARGAGEAAAVLRALAELAAAGTAVAPAWVGSPRAARLELVRSASTATYLGVRDGDGARVRLGRALWLSGDVARGRAWLDHARALGERVALECVTGNCVAALRGMERRLAEDPQLVRVLASQLARRVGVDAALTAVSGLPATARVVAEAEAEAVGGRVDAAVARLEAARAAQAESAAELGLALARLHARFGSLVRAERLAEGLAASPAASPDAVSLLARLRVARRARLPETSARVARALAEAPDDAGLLAAQGRLLLALGREEDGRSLLSRAAWLDPTDAATLEHLADARARAGQGARAAQDYRRADAELAVLEALGEPGAATRRARLTAKRQP